MIKTKSKGEGREGATPTLGTGPTKCSSWDSVYQIRGGAKLLTQ